MKFPTKKTPENLEKLRKMVKTFGFNVYRNEKGWWMIESEGIVYPVSYAEEWYALRYAARVIKKRKMV